MATASRASSSLVIPQIFTNMRRSRYRATGRVDEQVRSASAASAGRARPRRGRRTSPASRRRGWRRSRRRRGGGRRRGSRTPDSATLTTPSGIAAAIRCGPLVVDLERHEVALVDADQRRPDAEGDLELGLVVDLDERVEAELGGQLRGTRSARRRSSAAAISSTRRRPSAGRRRRRAATTVKSLRSTGSAVAARAACEVVDRPAEELVVGEHRQARRAAGGVGLGDVGAGRGRR